ncbi:MAG: ABC transporter ATP-binding protein [Verrucomicrobia bacterium]|nr:ABC transporter ATP-binding protein [Verrucomicrobiota bacterium]
MLEIQNLKVEYARPDGSRFTVLHIPGFRLEGGAQVCIRGRSGSGKTTLLNVISGIKTPSAGTVKLDGKDLGSLGEAARDILRGQAIGFVFQTFNLLAGFTALENVILGSVFAGDPDEETSSVRRRALELLQKVGLTERAHHRPRTLSSGEQQRVAIARALINRPKLILADEPTGSLDEKNSGEVLDLMARLGLELRAALLLVTHDPAVMSRFVKVVDLKELNRIV